MGQFSNQGSDLARELAVPPPEVSSSPWSCNRNRKAVRKSTSPTEITLASVSARAVAVAREFLGIRNSVVRLSVGLSADARSRGLQAGSRSVDFRGRRPSFFLVGVARDKSESLRSRNLECDELVCASLPRPKHGVVAPNLGDDSGRQEDHRTTENTENTEITERIPRRSATDVHSDFHHGPFLRVSPCFSLSDLCLVSLWLESSVFRMGFD